MSKSLEPRAVPITNAKQWLIGGLELASRKPLHFIALWGVATFAAYLLPVSLPMHLGISLVALFISTLIAEASDKSLPFLAIVTRLTKAQYKEVAIAISMTLVVLFGFSSLAIMLLGGLEGLMTLAGVNEQASQQWNTFSDPQKLNYVAGWLCNDIGGFWLIGSFFAAFIPQLLMNVGVPLRVAFSQCMTAMRLNRFIGFVPWVTGMIMFYSDPMPIIGLPVASILICSLYMAYKDIWLGSNEPYQKSSKRAFRLATN